ncbi:MAG TPA: aldolase, partial [Nocardioides sp.]|nr:aldolase [Nocardioides sp.]
LGLVRDKLAREPVEDVRIDLEDGYGTRPDDEEDADAARAADELAATLSAGTAPAWCGIRCKSFEAPTRRRGIRTLSVFLERLLAGTGLPDGFVVTLPKVTAVEQVEALVHASGRLEPALGLAAGALRFEIQVETPQSILGPDGTALVARMVHASEGRCTGLHYGTYDYSAYCGIAAAQQSLDHPVADHAKAIMQAAAAGTGVRLSDGSTNVLPVGDADQVEAAWANHLRLVRRSLERGYYQGWDLHPAQLPTRFAATFAFYRDGWTAAAARLRTYVERRDSGVLDEPATARALADFLLRGIDCGALGADEVADATGLDTRAVMALAHRAAGQAG